MLWLTVIISKLVIDEDYYAGTKKIYIELIIAWIFIFFIRQNGIVPYILSAVVLGVVYKKNKKISIKEKANKKRG